MEQPILRWCGGKSRLVNQVLETFPKEMKNYYEPFVGGGSILFGLLKGIKSGKFKVKGEVFASDSNESLIHTFKNIQSKSIELYNELLKLTMTHKEKSSTRVIDDMMNPHSKEGFYYSMRKVFNGYNQIKKNSVKGSALFIFLNITGYGGLFREGVSGFNVSFGFREKIKNISKDRFLYYSHLVKDVHFSCCDFDEQLKKVERNDFVYLDPPYVPVVKGAFVRYSVNVFSRATHLRLFDMLHVLIKRKRQFVMSNSVAREVISKFKNSCVIERILCKRTINKLRDFVATEVLVCHKT